MKIKCQRDRCIRERCSALVCNAEECAKICKKYIETIDRLEKYPAETQKLHAHELHQFPFESCGNIFEVSDDLKIDDIVTCPRCGGDTVLSTKSIQKNKKSRKTKTQADDMLF